MLAHFNIWCIKVIKKNKSGPEKKTEGLYFFNTHGRGGGVLNFHLGIGVKRPNKGLTELTTTKFGALENWISEQNIMLWTDFWPYFEALELTFPKFWRLLN